MLPCNPGLRTYVVDMKSMKEKERRKKENGGGRRPEISSEELNE